MWCLRESILDAGASKFHRFEDQVPDVSQIKTWELLEMIINWKKSGRHHSDLRNVWTTYDPHCHKFKKWNPSRVSTLRCIASIWETCEPPTWFNLGTSSPTIAKSEITFFRWLSLELPVWKLSAEESFTSFWEKSDDDDDEHKPLTVAVPSQERLTTPSQLLLGGFYWVCLQEWVICVSTLASQSRLAALKDKICCSQLLDGWVSLHTCG